MLLQVEWPNMSLFCLWDWFKISGTNYDFSSLHFWGSKREGQCTSGAKIKIKRSNCHQLPSHYLGSPCKFTISFWQRMQIPGFKVDVFFSLADFSAAVKSTFQIPSSWPLSSRCRYDPTIISPPLVYNCYPLSYIICPRKKTFSFFLLAPFKHWKATMRSPKGLCFSDEYKLNE